MKLEYIDKVTLKYGDFTISDYLCHTGRSYATFIIDYSQKDMIHYDGLPDNDLKEHCLEGFNMNSKGIYALYGERHCKSSNKPVEVLMLEKELWASNDEELKELLIFHEVCHLLEKNDYYKNLNIELSEYELKVGAKLHEVANKIDENLGGWGSDENHNQTFGAILFHFLRQYDNDNCHHLLAKSMIKNFLDDYTQTFQKVT